MIITIYNTGIVFYVTVILRLSHTSSGRTETYYPLEGKIIQDKMLTPYIINSKSVLI